MKEVGNNYKSNNIPYNKVDPSPTFKVNKQNNKVKSKENCINNNQMKNNEFINNPVPFFNNINIFTNNMNNIKAKEINVKQYIINKMNKNKNSSGKCLVRSASTANKF